MWEVIPGSQLFSCAVRRELDRAVPVQVLTNGEDVVILRSNREAMRPEIDWHGKNIYKP